MESKRIIWLMAAAGGWLGGYVPALWGADYFSFSSIIFGGLGAFLGIYIAFKLTH